MSGLHYSEPIQSLDGNRLTLRDSTKREIQFETTFNQLEILCFLRSIEDETQRGWNILSQKGDKGFNFLKFLKRKYYFYTYN